MFTGIVQAVGEVAELQPCDGDLRLRIRAPELATDTVNLGDSIASNGVCLTAVELPGDGFWADVSQETLTNTTIPQWQVGTRVNLEKALTPSTPLGGHMVSGHVDGVGEVVKRYRDGRSERFEFAAPAGLAKYIAAKGSITIDGTSLTVNSVEGARFAVNIVPHTLTHTVIGNYQVGSIVNLEVDIIARYLERLLTAGGDTADNNPLTQNPLTMEFLAAHGFVRAND